MKISAYAGHIQHKSSLRYIIFAGVITTVLVLSLLYQNYIGFFVVCLFVGGYLFFSVHSTQKITIQATENKLYIGDQSYDREEVEGFFLEQDPHDAHLGFIIKGKISLYTLPDFSNQTKEHLLELPEYTPLVDRPSFSGSEKLIKRLKL